MWSIALTIKNKLPILLHSVYDTNYYFDHLPFNKYRCGCLDKNMKLIHDDYNSYCVEYWTNCEDTNLVELKSLPIKVYAQYTIPYVNDLYLELLKNYYPDISDIQDKIPLITSDPNVNIVELLSSQMKSNKISKIQIINGKTIVEYDF